MPDLSPDIRCVERISEVYAPVADRIIVNPTTQDADKLLMSNSTCSHTDARLRAYCVVELKGPSESAPDNVLLEGVRPLEGSGRHMRKWRFVGLPGEDGEFGCGISCKELCGSGWQMEGVLLMANGSLANGSLSGPQSESRLSNYSSTNPCVDWIISVEDLVLDVFMVVNDTFCGQTFHLKFLRSSTLAKLRPVISFSQGTSHHRVAFFDYDVMTISDTLSLPPNPRFPSDCTWTPLSKSFEGVEFPPQDNIILEATPRGCSLRVFNTLKSPASFEADGSIQCVGPVTASRMSPPPPFDHTEKVMSQMLETMTRWEITASDHLLNIYCTNGEVRSFCVNRAFMRPVIENPFVDL